MVTRSSFAKHPRAPGLTYRDVNAPATSFLTKRGRTEFILHISRLADIENRMSCQ